VRGPSRFTIEMRRDYSYLTVLNGIALDSVEPFPVPYFNERLWSIDESIDLPKDNIWYDLNHALQEWLNLRERNFEAWGKQSHAIRHLWRTAQAASIPNDRIYHRHVLWIRARIAHAAEQYQEYEQTLRMLDAVPAREIENALRWGGEYSSIGRGREVIIKYLKTTYVNMFMPEE